MHSLSLYGLVPAPRHEQVLNILAGLAAMQPQPIYERHIVYRPLQASSQAKPNKKYPPGSTAAAKPVQQIAIYQQLVQSLRYHDFGRAVDGDDVSLSASGNAAVVAGTETETTSRGAHGASTEPSLTRGGGTWTLRMQDIPEPETKTVALRRVSESAPLASSEIEAFADVTKYTQINTFIKEGHRLITKDLVLTMHRILRLPITTATATSTTTTFNDPTSDPIKSQLTSSPLPPLDTLHPLDPSGSFLLEASVRVDDRSKTALVQTAMDELNWFRNEMKGSVEMRVPERLALDTRVRG